MEGKQDKQMAQFSEMATGSYYFFIIRCTSKQRWNVKTYNTHRYDPYQIKLASLAGHMTTSGKPHFLSPNLGPFFGGLSSPGC